VELAEAWAILDMAPCNDARLVRSQYMGRLHSTHPDVSPHAGATAETAKLNIAFGVITRSMLERPSPPTSPPIEAEGDPVGVVLLGDDTIGVDAPHSETYVRLVEACHQLGEVTHVEPGSGLLSVVISFVDAPTCQLLLTLQGRATGLTEITCTIESIGSADAPPIDAVTRLLLDELLATAR
jgi:hypothetical protein